MPIDRFTPKNLPAHLCAYVCDGVVYLPLEPFGSAATVAAGLDGLKVLMMDDHAYAPVGWLKGICPERRDQLDAVEANLLRQAAEPFEGDAA